MIRILSIGENYINNSAFRYNKSVWGGALTISNCDLIIDSCLFLENYANSNAGAIEYFIDTLMNKDNYDLSISSSNFIKNFGYFRGALEIQQRGVIEPSVNVEIDKCKFIDNSTDRGGNILINGSGTSGSICQFLPYGLNVLMDMCRNN